MRDLVLAPGKKAIIIVAHPDDEIIWMGATVLKNPRVNWTIVSLCRASDTDREPKFKRVSAHLGAEGMIFDADDEGRLDPDEASEEDYRILAGALSGQHFDYAFTHGRNGEYGHPGHIAVYQALRRLRAEKKFEIDELYHFSYKKNRPGQRPLIVSRKESGYVLRFDKGTMDEKKRIVAEMYGYPYDGIDVGYCTDPETFVLSKQ